MEFFRRIFKAEPAYTRLERFVRKIDAASAEKACEKAKTETHRTSMAISLLTLYSTQQFCDNLQDALIRVPKPFRPLQRPSFDVVMFEGAAYAHYYLMKDYFPAEDECEDDPHLSCLSDAAYLTGSMIGAHTDFKLPEGFFYTRTWSYGRKQRSASAVEEEFAQTIQASITAGQPIVNC